HLPRRGRHAVPGGAGGADLQTVRGGPVAVSSGTPSTLTFKGIGASPGVAMGHAFIIDRKRVRTPKARLGEDELEPELMRIKTAIELSDFQLSELKDRLGHGEGQEHALILEAHRLMLHDPMFV